MTTEENRPVVQDWHAWVAERDEPSMIAFMEAVEEGKADRRVYERGYYHGVRSRLGLPTVSAQHQRLIDLSPEDGGETVSEKLEAQGLGPDFFGPFMTGMLDAIGDADVSPE